MQKNFIANLVFILIINLIIKPLYVFGVEVGVQNALGAESYGLFFALLNSAYLLQIVNDFGIQVFHNREVATDRTQLQILLPGLLIIKLAFSVLYILLIMLLGWGLGYTDSFGLLLLIGFNLVLVSFVLFIRSGISGLGYYRIDSVLSVLDKFLMILLIGGMLLLMKKGSFTLYHFVLGQTGALFLTAGISWLLLNRYSRLRFAMIPLENLRALVIKAFPYALVVFLMTLYTRADGVMIKALLPNGDFEAGIYAAGYRILDAVNMIAFLYAVMLLPMFSRVQESMAVLQALLDESVRYMVLLVIPLCSFAVIYREDIMELLYIEATPYWGLVFALLISTFLTAGALYVFGTLLTAMGRVRSMNSIYATTAVLNILLNFILIPRYHAAGAAVATVLTQLFAASGVVVLCFRIVAIRFSRGYWVRLLVFALLTIATVWAVGSFIFRDHWFISIPVMGVAVAAFAFVLRIVALSEMKSLLLRRA